MHRFISVVLTILATLLLNACSVQSKSFNDNKQKYFGIEDDRQTADFRLEQVVECINSKNTNGLKTLFSNKVLNEDKNFEKNAELLFDFIEGKIISWDASDDLTVTDTNDYGEKVKEIHSYYYLNTKKQTYFLMIFDCPNDTQNIDNEGINMLLVVKKEDEPYIWDGNNKILYDGDKKLLHTGIYLPVI